MTPLAAPRADVRPLAAFCATLVLLTLATVVGVASWPAVQQRAANIAMASRPPDGASYLAHDRGGHVDHHVLYFGTDEASARNLERAEVLFVGNSRLMFALPQRVLAPFFAERGLSYFVMGFGFNEGDAFPLAIIERFQLRPRLVVVNVDGFFGAGLSPWAEQVVLDSVFDARKRRWEADVGHEARRGLHALLPNWLDLLGRPGFAYGREFIAYRSRDDGTWFVSPWPEGTDVIAPPPMDAPALGGEEIAAAHRFAASLASRGSALVLTSVPAPTRRGGGPAHFASLLGAPLVAPTVAALTTHDNSHLAETSALEWSRAFLGGLEPHLAALAPGRR